MTWSTSTTRSNFKVQARCGLDAFLHLVAFLERSSIYDSGLIILMSDHGSSLYEPSQPRALDKSVQRSPRALPAAPREATGEQGAAQDLTSTGLAHRSTCDYLRGHPDGARVSVLSLPEHTKRERVSYYTTRSRPPALRCQT